MSNGTRPRPAYGWVTQAMYVAHQPIKPSLVCWPGVSRVRVTARDDETYGEVYEVRADVTRVAVEPLERSDADWVLSRAVEDEIARRCG